MDQLTVTTHNQKLELWIGRIRDCRASGMRVADWCDANGIGIKTYYYWMRKIKREAFDNLAAEQKAKVPAKPEESPFVEVHIPQTKPDRAVRVYFSQAMIDIPDGVNATTIANVFSALSRIC